MCVFDRKILVAISPYLALSDEIKIIDLG